MERKQANLERWRKYGQGRCGLDEAVIRGARVPEGAEPATTTTTTTTAGASVEPPTEQLAAASLGGGSTDSGHAASTTTEASDATLAAPPTSANAVPTTPGAEPDKFVDAPVAPQAAVEKAVPSVA